MCAPIVWLDQHSGSATVLLTAALVGVTWRYVVLTGRLLKVQEENLEDIRRRERETLQNVRWELDELARTLKATLAQLPPKRMHAESIRHVDVWTEGDLGNLQRLASTVGGDVIGLAGRATVALRALRKLVVEVQATEPGNFDWNRRYPENRWPEYLGHIELAEKALEALFVPPTESKS